MKHLLLSALVLLVSLPVAAQSPPTGRLIVTVFDQTRAVIPNAQVTVTAEGDAAAGAAPRIVQTSPTGIGVVDALAAGRYTIEVAFPGFQTATLREVRVKDGDTRRSITLALDKREESLTVSRDKQSAALDQQGSAFSTVLTREQIDALPDDPDEMEKVLKAMAPPGSTIRVDGFTGGKLPPKSQIRSIRLPRMDMMAAQNHGGVNGAMHIDIMTQPGIGPLRGSVDFAFRDDAMNARNPFVANKGDEGLQRYGLSFSKTVKPNRSSFSFNVSRTDQFDTTNILAQLAGGPLAQAVRQPTEALTLYGRYDQAIGKDHAVRIGFQRGSSSRSNLGVGGFNLLDRAYSTTASDNTFRISENGPVGRRFFSESRLQLRWADSANASVSEAPAIRVLDWFNAGGAQQAGGSRAFEFEAASDLDYVRGKHSMRTGVLLEGGRYRTNDSSNYFGTYTFTAIPGYPDAMQAFLAGKPANYTQRIGNPDVRYSNLQAGVYLQDDYRVRKNVMLSYGLRYEAQTLVADQDNFSPRVTVSWTPFKSAKTTLRGGFGWFSDWLGTGVYSQALQVDGFRQREVNINFPSYPDPGVGEAAPTNRYLLAPSIRLPQSMTTNAGVDQQLGNGLRLNVTYTFRRGVDYLRGRNLNAPVNGVRPDPAFSNLIEVVSDAGANTHSVNVGATVIRPDWRRLLFAVNYTFVKSESNTAGAFALPANGNDLASEWGPVTSRHRAGGQFNMQVWRTLGISLSARAQSGTPYNITTGSDDNKDGVFNDRPAGVGRNSAWTTAQWDVGARVSYSIGFGQRPAGGGVGGTQVMVQIGGPGGGMPGGGISMSGGDNKRYHVEFYAAAQNITNRGNYVGYSGVQTSPFFGLPTTVLNPRKIELGTRFMF